MAIDDLDTLRDTLPGLFEDLPLPPGWDSWEPFHLDDPLSGGLNAVEEYLAEHLDDRVAPDLALSPDSRDQTLNRGTAECPRHPGAPLTPWSGGPPYPPDALAFYLPFHHYFWGEPDRWWGVYLLADGVQWLGRYLRSSSNGRLPGSVAVVIARDFLFGHEAFHHSVESFATKLEVTHRRPLYVDQIERRFLLGWLSGTSPEERLADAHGYRRAQEHGFLPENRRYRSAGLLAMRKYLAEAIPPYRGGDRFLRDGDFYSERERLAEDYHEAACPGAPQADPAVWAGAPHMFHGISRVTSRVNYLVRKGSPLSARIRTDFRHAPGPKE